MPELAVADVEQHTGGRLDQQDPETADLLARGLAAARRFCGWHVTPVRTGEAFKLNGKGGRTLFLPTLRLVELVTLVEDGTALDIDDLDIGDDGQVEKISCARWSRRLGGITGTMTHGFDTAPDFDAAVLSWIDRASLAPTGGRARVIGPFQYDTESLAAGSAFTVAEKALLDPYRLVLPA